MVCSSPSNSPWWAAVAAVFESLAQAGARGAKLALRVMAEPDRVLAAAQLGITMASLALGWIGEPFVSEVLRWPLGLIPAND